MTTPAAYTPGANDAFMSGVNHLTTGRTNSASITLGGSLQADSDQQNGMSPHSVLASTAGGQNDSPWERMSRVAGGYQPGQMEQMTDQLDQGSNDNFE
jgi:hypothetical protein